MQSLKVITVACMFLSEVVVAEQPTIQELFAKFAENQDRLKSFIIKTEALINEDNRFSEERAKKYSGKRKRKMIDEYRCDGNRMDFRGQAWNNENLDDKFNPVGERSYTSYLWDGQQFIRYATVGEGFSPQGVVVVNNRMDYDKASQAILSAWSYNFHLGYLLSDARDNERIDSLIHEAKTVTLRNEPDIIGGSQCYVIETVLPSGKYTLWMDPEHGYNIAKISGQHRDGDVLGKHRIKGADIKFSGEVVSFQKIGNIWLPMETRGKSSMTYKSGDFVRKETQLRVTDINLNPDHDALGSFVPDDIPNGTFVKVTGISHIMYTWQDGKLIPNIDKEVISEIDRMTKEIIKSGVETKPVIDSANPTVSELLDQYAATQDKLKSFIAKGETTIKHTGVTNRTENETCEFRTDGRQFGHRATFQDNLTTTKDKPGYKSFLWDSESLTQYKKGIVFIIKNAISQKRVVATEYKGSPLLGICGGDYDRIDSILRKAGNATVRQLTEKVGDSYCYFIEARIKQSGFKVWIDPHHGYNIAQIEIERKDDAGAASLFTLKNVRFEKIDNIWVTMEADMEQTKGSEAVKWNHKRTEMILNPDHDALKSFIADDIPDGTKVNISGEFGAQYTWRNGRPIKETRER